MTRSSARGARVLAASIAGLKSKTHPLASKRLNEDAVVVDWTSVVDYDLNDAVYRGWGRRIAVLDGHGSSRCPYSADGARFFGQIWAVRPYYSLTEILDSWASVCLNGRLTRHADVIDRDRLLAYGSTFAGYDHSTRSLTRIGDIAAVTIRGGSATWLCPPAEPDTPTDSICHRHAALATPKRVPACDHLVLMSDGVISGFGNDAPQLLAWLPAFVAWCLAGDNAPYMAQALHHTFVSSSGLNLAHDDASIAIITPSPEYL